MTLAQPHITSPLKRARLAKKASLLQTSVAVQADIGHLSRIENLKNLPSPGLAERLAIFFADQGLNEMMLLYPKRYGGVRDDGKGLSTNTL